MTVFFQRRSASRCVDDDRVDARSFECFDVAPGAIARARKISAVRKQRAATSLSRGCDHVITGAIQQLDTRAIGFAKHHCHDATAHKPDSTPRFWRERAREFRKSNARELIW